LVPQPARVRATTKNVDAELALQAGPQLVVPILNARYALNAANARWSSLYDALYGTDAIPEKGGAEKGKGYNPKRGAKVIAYARQVLDNYVPLKKGSHADATGYSLVKGELVPQPARVRATTKNVDAELALQAGPQLVVPILNARYALNAANARWSSLYDALYGTDAIPEKGGAEKGKGYNPKRGAKVIAYARQVLDNYVPLKKGSHADATGYSLVKGELVVSLKKGATSKLAKASQLVGYTGKQSEPSSILFQHNGLHLDLQINRNTPIGASDKAGVSDLIVGVTHQLRCFGQFAGGAFFQAHHQLALHQAVACCVSV